MAYVNKLFDMERLIHSKVNVNYDDIKKYRTEKEVPVLDGFFKWLDAQTAINGSRFDKALIYIRNRKLFLTNYLEDGGCSFNNNTSERSCIAFVTGRKNWMFSDTPTVQTVDKDLEKLCPWNPECREIVEEMHRQEIQASFNA